MARSPEVRAVQQGDEVVQQGDEVQPVPDSGGPQAVPHSGGPLAVPDSGGPQAVPHSGGKTRRRGAALETALLDAAWDELRVTGYAGLTMEAVADRAGTSRAVLYRRWRNRPELVIAAMRRHRPLLSGEVPDTGGLRGDVLAVLRRASAQLAEIGPDTAYGLLGDYFADAELFARIQDQFRMGAEVMTTILKRAADRGEVRGDIHPRIAALPSDLFRNELFRARTPPSERVLVEITDEVFLPLVQPVING